MKKLLYIFAALVLALSACEYDNYDPPTSELTGRFVYEGEPVGVRHDVDVLQLYEPGWQNFAPMEVHVSQDGTFSSLLFDGDYKLVLIKGNGPWVDQPDTIDIHVRGSQTLDVAVEPFFMIRDEMMVLVNGNTLTASFNLDQIVEDSELEFVSLFVGKTRFVDNRFKMREERLGAVEDLSETITLNMDLSGVNNDFVFARIGVKAKGSPELLFTQVQKIQL
jgi:hypothetical protein